MKTKNLTYFVVVVFSACNANLFNNMAECCTPAELKEV